ncbi:hypothetical protein [Alkaliphilus serpentinus]|uniref:hypothetical protein n=1 Tax=Alkaliphilus serpentinus TaxID=1482731 RepID=UPI0018657EE6|nr:hypothetical protein [Alkaliphilus serpentinus]
MSRGFWSRIITDLDEKGTLFKKRTSSISNLSVIAGVIIVIVFFIVYMFFI